MILTVTPNPCVDKTVFIDRLEPGTFMRAGKCTCIPGGKGTNVSRAVKQMGRTTRAMVVVGGHPGRHVVDMIRNQDGIECVPAWVASQTRTITTVLEQPIHRQTAFFEPGSRVTPEEYSRIIETFRSAVSDAAVVCFSGTVSDPDIARLYADLIPIARDADARCILDSHGKEFAEGIAACPHMVKPNAAELEELVGRPLPSDADRWEAMRTLHDRGVALVVLSLGKDGAMISTASQRLRVVPPAIKEVNPVGSGDALVAAFAIGLAENMPLHEMARLGCAMGAANATSWEIGHFTEAEVYAVLPGVSLREL